MSFLLDSLTSPGVICEIMTMNGERKMRFEEASTQDNEGFLVEYLRFLSQNKKYWLIPIIMILFLIGVLVMLGGSAAGAFIYTLF